MKESIPYQNHTHNRRRQIVWMSVAGLFLLSFCFSTLTFAGNDPAYDETLVFLNVQDVGGEEIPSVIRGQEVYLSVTDVFDFIKIKTTVTSGMDSISGFFIDEHSKFLIDVVNSRIIYQDNTFSIQPDDLIKTETGVFIKSKYFGDVFGLECTFNFRNLSVILKSKMELPVIRDKRLEQMRLNLNRVKGENIADTSIGRKYPWFHLGDADWAVNSTQVVNGIGYTRLNLGLGGVVAGGELNTMFSQTINQPFSEKQQYYLWRFANNDHPVLRQVMAGRIAYQPIASIYEPVAGVQLTNAPTYARKSFGFYTLSDYTEPEWTVELYVNNVLIDYTKADVSGFFTFNVPLMYGNTELTLRYYGPDGEEQTSRRYFNIPFTFLPVNEFEYKISAGLVEDSLHSTFAQGRIDYGLSRSITVGGGVEYLSSISKSRSMPFLDASVKVASNAMFSAEYVYGVRSKTMLTYHLPCNLQFDLNYIKYTTPQEAVKNMYTEQRKAVVSMPFHLGNLAAFSRLSLSQNIYQTTKFNSADFLVTATLHGVNVNMTTYSYFLEGTDPYIYSNLSLSVLLTRGFIFTPKVRYLYENSEVLSVNLGIEKHILRHGSFNASYEMDFSSHIRYLQAGFKYDFSFAHVAFSSSRTNDVYEFSQSANGSLICEEKNIQFEQNSNIDRGGILILPFLDLNNNSKRDAGEPKVSGLNVRANGGGKKEIRRDSTISISGLEPYSNYFIELDGDNFENISWKLTHVALNIAIDPNQLKLIEVPVEVVGEASGTVYLQKGETKKGIGPIKITICRNDSIPVQTILTEGDGYFSYLGLLPGAYTAILDTAQIEKLNMHASPVSVSFTINGSEEGDLVDDLSFVLEDKKAYTEKQELLNKSIEIPSDNAREVENKLTNESVPAQAMDSLARGNNHVAVPGEHINGTKTESQSITPQTDEPGIIHSETSTKNEAPATTAADKKNSASGVGSVPQEKLNFTKATPAQQLPRDTAKMEKSEPRFRLIYVPLGNYSIKTNKFFNGTRLHNIEKQLP